MTSQKLRLFYVILIFLATVQQVNFNDRSNPDTLMLANCENNSTMRKIDKRKSQMPNFE